MPKLFQSKIFTALILIAVLFLVMALIRARQTVGILNREADNVSKKLSDAKDRNARLNERSEYLKSDAYLERQLRIKLNYKKFDEEAVIVYHNQESIPTVIDQDDRFSRLWNWLKNFFDKYK